jgi:protein-S-isoprenylcysteine O-methyltransferase Ste14
MKISSFALGTIVCWFLFAVFWLILRKRVNKNIYEQTAEQKLLAIANFTFYFALLYWPLFFAPERHTFQSDASGVIGLIICIVGVLLSVWSRLIAGKDWSSRLAIKETYNLITKGPYNIVRHPVYTGFILGLLGSAIAIGHLSGFIALGIMLSGLIAKIGQEEKVLSSRFPDDYESYQTRSKKLIPFIW